MLGSYVSFRGSTCENDTLISSKWKKKRFSEWLGCFEIHAFVIKNDIDVAMHVNRSHDKGLVTSAEPPTNCLMNALSTPSFAQ